MLAALQKLAELLGNDPLSVDETIAAVGTITQDHGSNLLLKPHDHRHFSAANLVRAIDLTTAAPIDAPSHVELALAVPAALEDLAQAFGPYREVPVRRNLPPRVIFSLDLPGHPRTVALIAEVRQGLVTKVTLRRDKRV